MREARSNVSAERNAPQPSKYPISTNPWVASPHGLGPQRCNERDRSADPRQVSDPVHHLVGRTAGGGKAFRYFRGGAAASGPGVLYPRELAAPPPRHLPPQHNTPPP